MIKKILKYLLLIPVGLICIILGIFFIPPLWRYWFSYPQMEKSANELQALRKEISSPVKLNTYRVLLHAHSYWSHDSEGTLHDLVPAAKSNDIDFIFLTDHAHGDLDTFPRGYKGNYDGVWIEPGSERQGMLAWPLGSRVLDWKVGKDSLIDQIVSTGGMLFYAHSEEEHDWKNSRYQGMEIYNIHTDFIDEHFPLFHIANLAVNKNKYRQWALREMFDEQHSILSRWDSLNSNRKIVGFSAVDAHENQSIRARHLKDGRVEWIGPNAKPLDTVAVSFWNRWLWEKPDKSGWIFKWMIDTYASSFNHVVNYVQADTASVQSIASHVKKGHLFFAFKSLGDAKGFMYFSKNSSGNVSAIPGDSVQRDQAQSLHAFSPLPGQFHLIHNGKTIFASSYGTYLFTWTEPLEKGTYRIEVHVSLNGNDVPWLYTNPIYIY